MRSEKEMMDLIINTAGQDDRILAVYMKGSRANPCVPKDIYQDFDIVYVVKETESFIEDTSWQNAFGTIMLKQEQDCDFGYGDRYGLRDNFGQMYSWLLLFDDGNRIDIGVETVDYMKKGAARSRLVVPLLDKAGCLVRFDPPTDEEFHVRPASPEKYRGCCSEFFWTLCDTVKGIARDELSFAMTTYHTLAHPMLEKMLEWYIGYETGFNVSCGKLNKYFRKYLPEDMYEQYVRTYPDGNYSHFRQAVCTACGLFHKTAGYVGQRGGFEYPQEYEKGFRKYFDIVEEHSK